MAIKKVIDVSANTTEAQKEFELLEQNIKDTDENVLKLERDLLKLEKARDASAPGTQAYKDYNKQIKKTRLRLKEEKMDLKELKNERKKNVDATKEQTKAQKEQANSSGLLNKLTGGLTGKISGMVKSIGAATKGMKLLKIAFIGTGIGALVVAVVSLIAAFKRSEKGQDMLKKGLAILGAVTNQIMDAFASFGEAIIDAVTKPKETWDSLVNAFKRGYEILKLQVFERTAATATLMVNKLKKKFLEARIAWNEFTGDSSEARSLKKELKDVEAEIDKARDTIDRANKQVTDGIDSMKESFVNMKGVFGGFFDETIKEMEIMGRIEDDRARARKMERELLTEVAEGRRKINEIRLQAEDREKYSATERIEMLREAQAIEDELAAKQIKAKKLVVDAMKAEQALGKTTMEDKDELARLEAELINLETKKLRGQRLLQTQITTALNQEKQQKEQEIKEEEERQKGLVDFKKALREAEANTLAEEHALQLEKNNEQFDQLQTQLKEQRELGLISEEEFEQYKFDIQQARRESNAELALKQDKEIKDKEKKIKDDAFAEDIKVAQEEEKLRQAKLGQAKGLVNGLQAIAQLGGKKSKALAIAGIVVDQISSASQTISNLGIANAKAVAASPLTAGQPFVALNTINAVASIAGGLAGAKKAISALKSNSTSPGGQQPPPESAPPPSSVSADPTPQPATPTFGGLGAGGENAIAAALSNQPPVQAFVVANDVSSAQSLERNIVNQATIG